MYKIMHRHIDEIVIHSVLLEADIYKPYNNSRFIDAIRDLILSEGKIEDIQTKINLYQEQLDSIT